MSAKRAILFLLVSVIVVWFVDQRFSHLSFSEPLLVGDLTAIQAKQVSERHEPTIRSVCSSE